MNAENDRELLNFGIGFTNIVERTTRANQELSRQEIEEGNICHYYLVLPESPATSADLIYVNLC